MRQISILNQILPFQKFYLMAKMALMPVIIIASAIAENQEIAAIIAT